MKIALTTDHAGFESLKWLQNQLSQLGHECVNYGPSSFEIADDYPAFMLAAAHAVAAQECEVGVILGGSGQGEAITANRLKGVRCALYYGPAQAVTAVDAEGHQAEDGNEILRLARQHNNANMLSLAARFLSQEQMLTAVGIWLETSFSGLERHARRIQQIDDLS